MDTFCLGIADHEHFLRMKYLRNLIDQSDQEGHPEYSSTYDRDRYCLSSLNRSLDAANMNLCHFLCQEMP